MIFSVSNFQVFLIENGASHRRRPILNNSIDTMTDGKFKLTLCTVEAGMCILNIFIVYYIISIGYHGHRSLTTTSTHHLKLSIILYEILCNGCELFRKRKNSRSLLFQTGVKLSRTDDNNYSAYYIHPCAFFSHRFERMNFLNNI